jgi:long-chain acyl-CoA synthetase
MAVHEYIAREFGAVTEAISRHTAERPDAAALIVGEETTTFAALDAMIDRVAAALQRDGLRKGDVIGICAATSLPYAFAYLGALRAGLVVAPLPPYASDESLPLMIADSGARVIFADAEVSARLSPLARKEMFQLVALDDSQGPTAWSTWLAPAGSQPAALNVGPADPFNIIYSSGTTGAPKGVLQPWGLRWAQAQRVSKQFGTDIIFILATVMCSNLTLSLFFQTLTHGGAVVLMPKFDPAGFLELIERHRVTHTILVPNQFQRIMSLPNFADFDLTSMRIKYGAAAPFPASLKADVLKRFPGKLVEFYGLTEGGGTTILMVDERPDKISTCGRPLDGHDIRIIDEAGRELPCGKVGEIVGRSQEMMTGYHNQPEKTAEAEWHDAGGQRFIRTGDLGWIDDEGFLTLAGRRKDVIISGGLNIYANDLEEVLLAHEAVRESAVVGAASLRWGETPVGFVVLKTPAAATPDEIRAFANKRLGKTQRLDSVVVVEALPRNPLGKVLKRDLRERLNESQAESA